MFAYGNQPLPQFYLPSWPPTFPLCNDNSRHIVTVTGHQSAVCCCHLSRKYSVNQISSLQHNPVPGSCQLLSLIDCTLCAAVPRNNSISLWPPQIVFVGSSLYICVQSPSMIVCKYPLCSGVSFVWFTFPNTYLDTKLFGSVLKFTIIKVSGNSTDTSLQWVQG